VEKRKKNIRIAEFSEIPLQIIPQFTSLFRTGICFCVSVTFVCLQTAKTEQVIKSAYFYMQNH